MSLPLRSSAVDPVVAGLLDLLGLDAGAVVAGSRRASPYRSTHALEEVDLVLPDGRDLPLVLKACGLAATRGVRPRLVMDGHRELWAYERILPALDLDAPRFFGVLHPEGTGERLVLERVAGAPLHLEGGLEAWRAAAGWLGRFHGRGLAVRGGAAASGRALAQDPALHGRWLSRALRRLPVAAGNREVEALRVAARASIRCLAACPATLVHGEFYPSNVIASRTPEGWRVRVLDWESIGIGPAALDVVALVTGEWSAAELSTLIDAYTAAAPEGLLGDAPEAALASARLVNALQWLGWSEAWTPPPHQRRDWWGEARTAARAVHDAGLR